jgi:hypothetical protein
VTVDRTWSTGDTLRVTLPMRLRTEPLPGTTDTIAVFYGPVLLAGNLGNDGLDGGRRYGPSAPQIGRMKMPAVPVFVSEPAQLLASIAPVAGGPLVFRTSRLGWPADVTLVPFWKAQDIRYTVYWKHYTPAAWEERKIEIAAAEARRRTLESSTIDLVDTGVSDSEKAHGFQGEQATQPDFDGRLGRVTERGWFSYTLRAVPDRPVALVATYRGSAGRRRVFDILVDGQRIATETLPYHPTELLDIEYAIPETLTRGRQTITVRFQPHAEAATGELFELRTVAKK